MFYSRNLNNKINRIQEGALQILNRDLKLSLKELLKKKVKRVSLPENIPYLAREIYEAEMGISSKMKNEIFRFSKNIVYGPRSNIQLVKPCIHTFEFES